MFRVFSELVGAPGQRGLMHAKSPSMLRYSRCNRTGSKGCSPGWRRALVTIWTRLESAFNTRGNSCGSTSPSRERGSVHKSALVATWLHGLGPLPRTFIMRRIWGCLARTCQRKICTSFLDSFFATSSCLKGTKSLSSSAAASTLPKMEPISSAS